MIAALIAASVVGLVWGPPAHAEIRAWWVARRDAKWLDAELEIEFDL